MVPSKIRVWALGLVLALTVAYAQPGRAGFGRNQPQSNIVADSAALNTLYQSAREAAVRIETTPSGVGSGFVISEDGLVMTAYHVVRSARSLTVVTSGGERYAARVVGFDEYGDVALIDIDASGLTALSIDFTDTPEPGDVVLAIGNSRGEFNAPRAGQVVALDQTLSASFPEHLIASTLPLAPGDSGGPILDKDGEVVGVAVAVATGPGGYSSFASPLFGDSAREVVAALESGLQRGVPFMGVSLLELTPQTAAELGFGVSSGLLVTEVVPGSGAEAAGLQNPETLQGRGRRGGAVSSVTDADVITAVDGQRVTSAEELIAYLRGLEVGDAVSLSVLRGSESLDVTVTLGTRTL